MSYAHGFAQAGLRAERLLDKQLDGYEAGIEQDEKLAEVQDAWDEAVQDGVVTSEELRDFEGRFEAAGLGNVYEALQQAAGGGPVSGTALDDLTEQFDITMRRAGREASKGRFTLELGIKYLMSEVEQKWSSATNASKSEHDTYMNVIRNLA